MNRVQNVLSNRAALPLGPVWLRYTLRESLATARTPFMDPRPTANRREWQSAAAARAAATAATAVAAASASGRRRRRRLHRRAKREHAARRSAAASSTTQRDADVEDQHQQRQQQRRGSERRQQDHLGDVLADQELDHDRPAWGSSPVPAALSAQADQVECRCC